MRYIVAGLVVALLAAPARADNPHLARAEAALEDLDYTIARTELQRALRLGVSGPAELARIYLLSGIVSGAFGESRAARRHFSRALALRPHARLPRGYAPKIADPFEEALESKQRLVVDCSTGTLDIVDDPLELVDAVDASDAFTVAVDEYGNQLTARCIKPVLVARRRRSMPPPGQRKSKPVGHDVIGPFTGEADSTPPKRNVFTRWQLWGAAGVAAGVAGSYFANDATADDEGNARSQKYAFGTAAVCGAAALLFAIDEYRDNKRARRGARAAVLPTRGGGAVFVTLGF